MPSYYLDDMDLPDGSYVKCKASIACFHITEGKTYRVEHKDCGLTSRVKGIINDIGDWIIPSARFTKEIENV